MPSQVTLHVLYQLISRGGGLLRQIFNVGCYLRNVLILNLNLIYEKLDWNRKWLVDFNAGKTQLVLFDWSNNTGAIDVKMNGSVKMNHLLRCWDWLSLLNLIGALTLSLLIKLPPTKLEPWYVLRNFFLLGLLCISINLPYTHAWNTVTTSGLLPIVATSNC